MTQQLFIYTLILGLDTYSPYIVDQAVCLLGVNIE